MSRGCHIFCNRKGSFSGSSSLCPEMALSLTAGSCRSGAGASNIGGGTGEPYDRHALRLLFNACDPCHTGAITKANLLEGCRRLQLDDLTEGDADALFAELDVDGGGRVSFDAFADRFVTWSQQTLQLQRDDTGEYDELTDLPNSGFESQAHQARCRQLLDYYNADPSCSLLQKLLVEEWKWDLDSVAQLVQSLSPQCRYTEDELMSAFSNALKLDDDGVRCEEQNAAGNENTRSHAHERHAYLQSVQEESLQGSGQSPVPRRLGGVQGYPVRRQAVDLNSGTESELDTYFPALKGRDDLQVLWEKLRTSRPELLDPFSSFLGTVSQQLEEAEDQRDRMTVDLQREARELDKRAIELDEEATLQIQAEKDKLKKQEEDRLQRLREQMLQEVEEREKKLELALRHVHGLQSKVDQLSQKEKQMESRCEELQQTKSSLETELHFQHIRQQELKAQIESSGHESPSLAKLSESDSEVLQKQLDSLRRMNTDLKRELQDRVDELVATEQSKRHESSAVAKSSMNGNWYESEEDWTVPFKGKPLQRPPKRVVRGPRHPYTSDEDTDVSPMPVSGPRRVRARGIEINRRTLHMQRRQLQSPVPLAMDRFLRRKSVANDSEGDSDDQVKRLGRRAFDGPHLDSSLVVEANEAAYIPSIKTELLVDKSPHSGQDQPAGGRQHTSRQNSMQDLDGLSSPLSAGMKSDEGIDSSFEKQGKDSGIEATPAHASRGDVHELLSPQSYQTPHSSAAMSEPENVYRIQHSAARFSGDTERPLMSDSGFMRSQSQRYQRSGTALQKQSSFQHYTTTGQMPVRSAMHRGVPGFEQYVEGRHFTDPHSAQMQMPGAQFPSQRGTPNVLYSPRSGRRFSPASSGTATPRVVELADDRVSLHSYDGSVTGDDRDQTFTAGFGTDQAFVPHGGYEPYGTEWYVPGAQIPGDTYQPLTRTMSLQPHKGAVKRSRNKRKTPAERNVRQVATSVHPAQQTHALVSSTGGIPFRGSLPLVAASVPAGSPRRLSEDNLEGSDEEGMPGHRKTGALTKGGNLRDSAGNLSLMEMTSEEQAAPGRPEIMPVVFHPIKAAAPQYHTRQRPISPSIAQRVGIMPERVFKVVLCGDSNVGKTSYIWRLCNTSAEYSGDFKATLGVDYKMKVLEVDGHITVLQLWDTAGQERFRTFTRQYFRKADGVICIYDVCKHESFVRVQHWLQDIEDATDGGIAIMILGNKYDVADVHPRPKRQVTYWQGQQQAQRAGAMFAEVSAKTGHGVLETCMELAKVLYSAEKEILDDVVNLKSAAPIKKKEKLCCG